MPEILIYFIFLLAFFFLEFIYFRIAQHYSIIDNPNHRSSHTKPTIRGGGIIFTIACLWWFFYSGFTYSFFVSGVLLIGLISFTDDLHTLKSGIRFLFHVVAVCLLLGQVKLGIEWYWLPLVSILIIGTINACNFMDGINGITGGYSLVTLLSLFYMNRFEEAFTSESLVVMVGLGLLVFIFFNFRTKAVCFAGDVGSMSIAFIVCFLLMQLIIQTQNLLFIGFLLVYGLDATTTIIFRLLRKENVFEAHRSHFYQFLANEKKWKHVYISIVYSACQLLINILIVLLPEKMAFAGSLYYLFLIILICGPAFLLARILIEGAKITRPI